ncbi:MAG: transporter substrate-binding domain-containing protein [Actinobacteria bacterium]|nr:transporter substrate-binding domain-containing protein [Actinomycetota bacterium]
MKKRIIFAILSVLILLTLTSVIFVGCKSDVEVVTETAATSEAMAETTAETVAETVAETSEASIKETLLDEIQRRGYVRVAMFHGPPQSWIDPDTQEWVGLDADYTKEIAKEIGVEVDPVVVPWAAIVPSLTSERVDAWISLAITEERDKVLEFSNPYWYYGDSLIVAKDSTIASMDDLAGKELGVVRGGAQEVYAAAVVEDYGAKGVSVYDNAETLLRDVEAGRLDAAIHPGISVEAVLFSNPELGIKIAVDIPTGYYGPEGKANPLYYAFKEDPKTVTLIEKFNEVIKKMQEDGRAEAIIKKYITNPAMFKLTLTGEVEK